MTMPLVILAVLSVVGGWIGWPHFMGGGATGSSLAGAGLRLGSESRTVADVGRRTVAGHGGRSCCRARRRRSGHDTTMEWILAGASLAWGLLGLVLGYFVYMRKIVRRRGLPQHGRRVRATGCC